MTKIKALPISRVTLKDDYYLNAFNKEAKVLLSYDTDRFLAGFYENAGLDTKGKTRYPGWERELIAGHTQGHYLTALSQAYESATADEAARKALYVKIEEMIYGLKECQDKLSTGLIWAGRMLSDNVEIQFDNIEECKGDIFKEAWVPWYTLHKIISGLVSVANLDAPIASVAKDIVSKLADWAYRRISGWSDETHEKVLRTEYGGMNDCLYDVYLITGNKDHLYAANAFCEDSLYKKVYESKTGDNVLNNHHANTTIPKFMGALKRYMVTGEEDYLKYAAKFWDVVTNDHSYITGGNSEWEHFGEDRILSAERTNCNCETCNSYNMLKMTKALYMITGDVKYADWYENTFINSIMASQNPESGTTTYFQPMATGYFKTYSTVDTKFWCCTGSGMENFSKLGEGFYFSRDGRLIINCFVSSLAALDGTLFDIKEELLGNSSISVTVSGKEAQGLYIRIPDWSEGEPQVFINGAKENVSSDNGYIDISRTLKEGDCVSVKFDIKVRAFGLFDDKNVYAFKYGPYVLEGLLGTSDMEVTTTGVDVTIAKESIIDKKYIPSGTEEIKISDTSLKDFISNIDKYLVKDGFSFALKGTDSCLSFVPRFSQHKERFGLYFKFV